ncbi:serglycin [Megalops cyprinoides]|uniref:serglycin n=1 Tax=Megalops cyprinoides TaxID=118141 RepID=UPI0018653CB6|nr:serglycin [Megalops cyprinoides]
MGLFLKISVVLALLCLLGHNAQGAPTKGRYMWVKCRPDGKNSNCEQQQGPWIDLPGPSNRLPSSAVKDLLKNNQELDTKSTEGSGASEADIGSGDQWMRDGQQLGVFGAEEGSTQLEEGSTEVDYTEYVFPERVKKGLNNEMQEEHLIL